jgi:hypothetical protein
VREQSLTRSPTSCQPRTCRRQPQFCFGASDRRQVSAVGCHRTVKERPRREALACCDQPSMGTAGAGLECLDRDYRTTRLSPAISGSERTGRTTIRGRTRCLSVHCGHSFGRRRRCARTFPGRFMPLSNCATSRSLIDSPWLLLAVPGGASARTVALRRHKTSPRRHARIKTRSRHQRHVRWIGLPYSFPKMMS